MGGPPGEAEGGAKEEVVESMKALLNNIKWVLIIWLVWAVILITAIWLQKLFGQ